MFQSVLRCPFCPLTGRGTTQHCRVVGKLHQSLSCSQWGERGPSTSEEGTLLVCCNEQTDTSESSCPLVANVEKNMSLPREMHFDNAVWAMLINVLQ